MSANGSTTGVSIEDLPKSHVFTDKLPPDPQFPTPESSAKAPRSALGPRMVKEALYTFVRPDNCEPNPELLAVSPLALQTLGLSPSVATSPTFLSMVSGGESGFEKDHYPWAQCYGGWQFGQWAGQLGDGRAISLFEATNPESGKRYEIQLKGAGMTPYSRFADGKAVVRSSIREFVVSEYLHSIGIPSTRALALTLLPGQRAARERVEPCAIVTRFAESWVRIGTFDLLRWRGDRVRMRKLADYVIEEVLRMPAVKDGENRYLAMYREIVRRNAETVAKWQIYGFMNGVLNTDNTSIMGLSLDFGPFAFMDNFDPSYTPNHDDHLLRYSYKSQPTIIWWNLVRLGEDLAELFAAEDPDSPDFIAHGVSESDAPALISRAESLIKDVGDFYKTTFMTEYQRLFTQRLGLREQREGDVDKLFAPCLDAVEAADADFHHFFRRLAEMRVLDCPTDEIVARLLGPNTDEDGREMLEKWVEKYVARLREEGLGEEERIEKMKRMNPRFVPKSWILDELIRRVEKGGEREVLKDVMELVRTPFEDGWETVKDAERWCGPVPQEGRATQCSCSS